MRKFANINNLIENAEKKEEYAQLITYAKIYLAFCYSFMKFELFDKFESIAKEQLMEFI